MEDFAVILLKDNFTLWEEKIKFVAERPKRCGSLW